MPIVSGNWRRISFIGDYSSQQAYRSRNPSPFRDFLLPDELSEANWKQTLHDFEAAYHTLRTTLHRIKDGQLEKPSPKPGQSFYDLIIGNLQHDAYHLGQIVMLKKNI